MWITPITDRTIDDVDFARSNRASPDSLKGAQNASDWNRLAQNMYHIAAIFNKHGYNLHLFVKPDWKNGDIPRERDIVNFRDDLIMLQRMYSGINSFTVSEWNAQGLTVEEINQRSRMAADYYSKVAFPNIPYTHYEKINEIEKISLELYAMIDNLSSLYKTSGTYGSGQLSYLPHFIEAYSDDMTVAEWNAQGLTVAQINARMRTFETYYKKVT